MPQNFRMGEVHNYKHFRFSWSHSPQPSKDGGWKGRRSATIEVGQWISYTSLKPVHQFHMFLVWNAMSEWTRIVNWREMYEKAVVICLKVLRKHSLRETEENN